MHTQHKVHSLIYANKTSHKFKASVRKLKVKKSPAVFYGRVVWNVFNIYSESGG